MYLFLGGIFCLCVVEAFTGRFCIADKFEGRKQRENDVEQFFTGASDLAERDAHEDLALFELVQGFFHLIDGVACPLVGLEHAAVAPDGAVAHIEGFSETCESVLEDELHMDPAGKLGAMAHHEMVVVLAVRHVVDTPGDEWMKLDHPFGLGIGAQLGARDGREKRQVSGTAEAFAGFDGDDIDGALREDVEGEDDLIVGTCVAALLQLLAQLVKAEDDAAAIVGLVEITGLLVDGKLAQGMFDQFFVRAGVKIPMLAVEIFHLRGIEGAAKSFAKILKLGDMVPKKLAVNSGFRHGLAADRVARNVIPEIGEVRETIALLLGIGKKILEKHKLPVFEFRFCRAGNLIGVFSFFWNHGHQGTLGGGRFHVKPQHIGPELTTRSRKLSIGFLKRSFGVPSPAPRGAWTFSFQGARSSGGFLA